jgi:hypothetical protein
MGLFVTIGWFAVHQKHASRVYVTEVCGYANIEIFNLAHTFLRCLLPLWTELGVLCISTLLDCVIEVLQPFS